MEWRSLIIFLVLLIKTVDKVRCSCNLSLKNDFGKPSPVYLHNGRFLAPNIAGAILLRRGEIVQVACPGNKKFVIFGNDSTSLDIVDVKCVSNSTFRATKSSWVGPLRELHCNEPPWFTAEKTSALCQSRHHIYRVGYTISSVFHTLYEACFDSSMRSTRYVKHRLSPANIHVQISSRPQFIEGDVFPEVAMSKIYKMAHQKQLLTQLLGPGMGDRYITKNQFLNRGHLAAKADFSMAALQRASFHYINTAPQWMRGNAGDWAALEEALRRRLKTYNSSVEVYTGTHGICTLTDSGAAPQELYLHMDSNNNGLIPVPLYFYKLVYDPKNKSAAAFISINSPYYNRSTIDKLSFCSDICSGDSRYSWLRWRANDGTHSFCCEYSQFISKIDGLPKLDVKGLFY